MEAHLIAQVVDDYHLAGTNVVQPPRAMVPLNLMQLITRSLFPLTNRPLPCLPTPPVAVRNPPVDQFVTPSPR